MGIRGPMPAQTPVRTRYLLVAVVACGLMVLSILLAGTQPWLTFPALAGAAYATIGSRRVMPRGRVVALLQGQHPEDTVVTEADYTPPDSNGFREMQWCACGSTEDSTPVQVDVGNGPETIGWLCPGCRGDRHGPDPEPKRPTPPHRPAPMPNPADTRLSFSGTRDQYEQIKAYWMGKDTTTLCSYCHQPPHGYDGTHTYRGPIRPAPAILGPGVEVRQIEVAGKAVNADDVSLTSMKKALRERGEAIDAILRECASDTNAVYVSERQSKDLNRLRGEADALMAAIKDRQTDPAKVLLQRQVRCARRDGHEWTEIRSHESDEPVRRFCEQCGFSKPGTGCEHPRWHENYNSAGVLTQLQCPCGANDYPRHDYPNGIYTGTV
jgi:hypothetical protein